MFVCFFFLISRETYFKICVDMERNMFVVMSKTNVLLSVLHSRKLEKSGMKMKTIMC